MQEEREIELRESIIKMVSGTQTSVNMDLFESQKIYNWIMKGFTKSNEIEKYNKLIENVYRSKYDPELLLYKDNNGNELKMTFEFVNTISSLVNYLKSTDEPEFSLDGWKKFTTGL